MSIAKQIDKICDEFESAFRAGQAQKLSDVLANAPEELRPDLLLQLIEIEVELRLDEKQAVTPSDYEPFGTAAVRHAAKVKRRMTAEDPIPQRAAVPNEAEKIFRVQVPTSDDGGEEPTPSSSGSEKRLPAIGPYQLLSVIGKGGMGIVYKAEQIYPMKRIVALKLIRAGMGGREVLSRFEAERQALTLMSDQNVAKVLDAGTTPAGRPFFVMEFIEGIRITKYCQDANASLEHRLRLFLQICSAIQHAHQKGIIHRDIKPANILVTQHNGAPLVKVIDFGLAKALDASNQLISTTLQTATGDLLGTPLYMSPEQVGRNPLDIDTRTDVYSLGVLLYELLTGLTPLDKKMLLEDVLRAIREEEPLRPSLRLNRYSESKPDLSEARRTRILGLSESLKGDLDCIVMKSLEKDRNRRFESAAALADDVSRYLSGEVVAAMPPSTSYRLQKYIRRNRGLVMSMVSILILLIVGIIGTSWGMYQASVQAELAGQANEATQRKAEEARIASEEAVFEAQQARVAQQRAEKAERQAETDARAARLAEEKASSEAEQAKLARDLAESERLKTQTALENQERSLARANYFLANTRWRNHQPAEAKELLRSIPEKYRDLEWFLDWRLFDGSEVTLYGHFDAVNSVDFSPDGKRLLSGSSDTTVKIWDLSTNRELSTITSHKEPVRSVAFHPDGERIASAGDGGIVRLHNTNTGHELAIFIGHGDSINDLAFSPDGTLLASAGSDSTVRLWDIASGKQLHVLNHQKEEVSSIAFCALGTRLVSGTKDGLLCMFDAAEGTLIDNRLLEHRIDDIACSSDGTSILIGGGSYFAKYEAEGLAEQLPRAWSTTRGSVSCVAISPDDNTYIVGYENGELLHADENPIAWVKTLITDGHLNKVSCCAVHPNGGMFATSSEDGTIKIWKERTYRNGDTVESKIDEPLRRLDGHAALVSAIRFNNDGSRFATGYVDGKITIWDSVKGTVIQNLSGHTAQTLIIDFSPDGSKLLGGGGDDGMLRVWDLSTGRLLHDLPGRPKSPTCALFSPDGMFVVAGGDQELVVCETATGRRIRTIGNHNGHIEWVAITLDGSQLFSGYQGQKLKRWNVETGAELSPLASDGKKAEMRASEFFCPSKMQAYRFDDGSTSVVLYDVNDIGRHTVLGQHDNMVSCHAFSPNGKRLLTGGFDKTMRIWDLDTMEELRLYGDLTGPISSIACSPDDRYVVTGEISGGLSIWDSATVEQISLSEWYRLFVTSVAVNADGSRIASGDSAGEVKLWDAATGQLIRRFSGHGASVTCVSFSPNGRWLASLGSDNSIILMDIESNNETKLIHSYFGYWPRITFSPDSSTFAANIHGGRIRLWEAQSGNEIQTLQATADELKFPIFSPDGRTVSSLDRSLSLHTWDLEKNNANATTVGTPRGPGFCFAVSDDASCVALSDGFNISIVENLTGRELGRLSESESFWARDEFFWERIVAFNPDGRHVVASSNHRLQSFDITSGKVVREFDGHRSIIDAIAFSSDGRRIVSASLDRTIKLWDVETGKELMTFNKKP